jgi:hypothetical protein
VDELGTAAYWAGPQQGGWLANFPLPPGLDAGWHNVRLRFTDSGFSNTVRIAVDLSLNVTSIVCMAVHDPATWKDSQIAVADTGFLTCWVTGLPENSDRHNVRAWLGDTRLLVSWVGPPDAAGVTQINTSVPAAVPPGAHALRIECGGVTSQDWTVVVAQAPRLPR